MSSTPTLIIKFKHHNHPCHLTDDEQNDNDDDDDGNGAMLCILPPQLILQLASTIIRVIGQLF